MANESPLPPLKGGPVVLRKLAIVVILLVGVVFTGGCSGSPTAPTPPTAAAVAPPPPKSEAPAPPVTSAPVPTPAPTVLPNQVVIVEANPSEGELHYTPNGKAPDGYVDVEWGDFVIPPGPNGAFPFTEVKAFYTKDRKMLRHTASHVTIPVSSKGEIKAGRARLYPSVQDWMTERYQVSDVDGVVVLIGGWFDPSGGSPMYVSDDELVKAGVNARTEMALNIRFQPR